jgi:putative oxygen-independent coproporphyrinogen III oxidase
MGRSFPELNVLSPQSGVWDSPIAAYIHIPFCRRRCFYCDFPVSVIGDRLRGETSLSIQQYVNWICEEIRATPSQGQPLATVFFGGGTPSLLAAEQVRQILEALAQRFGLSDSPEISMEMDPGTFTLSHVRDYRQAGVNRVSLGAQAFQDGLLRDCGRTHQVVDIYEAIDRIRQAGIENLSLDLISGLPHQTLEQWRESLAKTIALEPNHVSAYDLVLEPGTVFGKRFAVGETPLPTDDLAAQMYGLASETLRGAGYGHYEISNYAKSGFECKHNSVYWRNGSYYGFGMGAASYVQGQRFSRPRNRDAYAEWLQSYIAHDGRMDEPITLQSDRLFETFMLGLRRSCGVDLTALGESFGCDRIERLKGSLRIYEDKGWVIFSADGRMCLSDPDGFLFSNTVLVSLWESLLEIGHVHG